MAEGGESQASDPNAMPLRDFISEAMQILKSEPLVEEVLVKRVHPHRFAAENGREKYEAFFERYNGDLSEVVAAHGRRFRLDQRDINQMLAQTPHLKLNSCAVLCRRGDHCCRRHQVLPRAVQASPRWSSWGRSKILALAVSQSSNWAVPSATRWRRSSRISLCHSGDSIASGDRDSVFRHNSRYSLGRTVASLQIKADGSLSRRRGHSLRTWRGRVPVQGSLSKKR
jgi:hypothetical protein